MKHITLLLFIFTLFSATFYEKQNGYYGPKGYRRTKVHYNVKPKLLLKIQNKINSNNIIYGTINGILYALNISNGSKIWDFPIGQSINRYPFKIYNGKIYFGRLDNRLLCLNAKTGKVIWKKYLSDDIIATPVIYKDKVYVSGGLATGFVLDANDGSIIKRFYTLGSEISPSIKDNNLILPGFRSIFLYKINGNDYNKIWTKKFASPFITTPVIDDKSVYIGSQDNFFYAVNLSDGKVAWKFETYGEILTTPYIRKNRIYFGSQDGNLYCVNKNNGKLLFKYAVGKKLVGNIIGNGRNIYFASANGNIYAIDYSRAFLKWKFFYNSQNLNDMYLINGVLIINSPDIGFYALSGYSGKLYWRTIKGHNYTEVLTDGKFIYFSNEAGKKVFKFNLNKKKMIWDIDIPQPSDKKPLLYKNNILIISDNVIFFIDKDSGTLIKTVNLKIDCSHPLVSGSNIYGYADKSVFCFNLITNKFLWTKRVDGRVEKGPFLDKNSVIFTTDKGYLYSFKKRNGKNIVTYKVQSPLSNSVAVNGKAIFFGASNNVIYGIDKNNGRKLWQFKTFGPIKCKPAIVGNKLIVVSYYNYIFCINTDNGKKIWSLPIKTHLITPPVIFGNYTITSGEKFVLYFVYNLNGSLMGEQFFGSKVKGNIQISAGFIIFTATSGNVIILKNARNN